MTAAASPERSLRDAVAYRRLLRYGLRVWWAFVIAALASAIAAAAMTAYVELLDRVIDTISGTGVYSYLPLAVVALVAAHGLASVISDVSLGHLSFTVIHRLRCDLFDRLLTLPSAFFDRGSHGQLVSRLTFTTAQVRDTVSDVLKTLLQEGLLVLGLVSYLLYQNWLLTLVFIVVTPAIGWVVRFAGKRFRLLSTRIQSSMGDVTQVANEVIGGHRVVKIFGGASYERTRFFKMSNAFRSQNLKMIVTKAISTALVQTIVAAALAMLVFVLIDADLRGGMDAGDAVAFLTAAGMLYQPLKKLSEVNAALQRGLAATHDVFSQLDEAPEQDRGHFTPSRVRGEVEFSNVRFRYPGTNQDVLSDISFRVEAGKTVALVGSSGSGKSTLAGLIARFHDASGGAITIDGRALEEFSLQGLRRQIAFVPQNVTLFNDSIEANIAYGDLAKADIEAVTTAAERAHALSFISNLPHGMKTLVGDQGVLLSGGQRQRIAIARALLKDAPILILDEATSSLDTESERYIQTALADLMRGRTTFVIAHRLSTIESADWILVLENGRIVEQGRHQTLLQRGGKYSQLHALQFLSSTIDA